ncbi:hypothetical protein GC170_17645 [bacterium]|nr:hypothetical protein [bacterium]
MSGRPIREQVLAWFAITVFFAIFVAPVLYAALFLNDIASGSGRFGLILPAIVLADAENRQSLLMAFGGSFSAVFAACVIGTGLGLASAQSGNRVYRAVRALALLPGRIPAWVFPACFAAGRAATGLSPIPDSMIAYVWFVWVGWWGAARIGEILANAARSVTRGEWDAARTLAGGSLPAMKVALIPRVAADYRKEAKRIAAVCLFDPTPVFFLGLANWPIGKVSQLFAAGDLRSLVDASSWLLLLYVIWTIVAFAFRLACGNHCRGNIVIQESSIPSDVTEIPAARSRAWLLPAMWPVLLAAMLAVAACIRLIQSSSGFRLVEIAVTHWEWIASWTLGSGVVLATGLFLAILARFANAVRAVRFLNDLTSFCPLEVAICSVGILTVLADRFVTGSSSVIFDRLASEIWFPVFFFFVAAGITTVSFRRSDKNASRSGTPEAMALAASEAAITLGIPKRHAEVLASRTWRGSHTKLPVATVLLSAWWLWNSPSWAIVPAWRLSPVPTGGQVLVSLIQEHDSHESGLAGVVIVMIVATILVFVKWAPGSKIRQTRSVL